MNFSVRYDEKYQNPTIPHTKIEEIVIVVDMQYDFITGTLANFSAEKLIKPMTTFLKEKNDKHIAVLFTQDTHSNNYLDTLEGKHLPIKHCIMGTRGHEIIGELLDVVDNYGIIQKPTFGIESENWEDIINKSGLFDSIDEDAVKRITLVGTCTDICVISNALILKSLFPEVEIYVYEDLCAGLTPEKHQAALEVMKSCQVNVEKYFKD